MCMHDRLYKVCENEEEREIDKRDSGREIERERERHTHTQRDREGGSYNNGTQLINISCISDIHDISILRHSFYESETKLCAALNPCNNLR